MAQKMTQSEYNARTERFKAALDLTFMLNVCHMDGPCADGCIGRVDPSAEVEYDRALEAVSDVEIVPDEPQP